MAKEVILDAAFVLQLLADPQFYVTHPCFLFMEEQGQAAVKKVQEAGDKQCKGCSQNYVLSTLGSFAKVLKRMQELQTPQLDLFVADLTRRLGYRPESILLYYKDRSGTLRELRVGRAEQGGSHAGTLHSPQTVAADTSDRP